jgi:putative protease
MIAEVETAAPPLKTIAASAFRAVLPPPIEKSGRCIDVRVSRTPAKPSGSNMVGVWLSETTLANLSKSAAANVWIWLPPVIWPDDEARVASLLSQSLKRGARRFVLNSPWQMGLFNRPEGLILWAGPFCNAANALCLETFKKMGFAGSFLSPELGEADLLTLCRQRPLPLGMVLSGHWPLCISRTIAEETKLRVPFDSPRGEQAWVERYGPDYWVFPNWRLDLTEHKEKLKRAGVRMFAHLEEPVPKRVSIKKRPGLWNWKIGLR